MASENETVADIIAEMRRGTKLPGYWRSCDVNKILQYHADRLDAAHRREVATTKESLAVCNSGDAVKLREALCEILSYIESFHKYITPGKGKKLTALFAVADTILSKARAALAAPVRNCDRFGGDIDKLREACARERGLNPEEDFPDVFPDWLLALSTEKKGGEK